MKLKIDFSFNRAADNFQKEFTTWSWRNWYRVMIVTTIIISIGVGLKYPTIILGRSDGTSISIYDASVVNRTQSTYEGRFYELPIEKETQTSQNAGPYFLYSQGTTGKSGYYYTKYALTYDMFGRLMTRNAISEETAKEAGDIEYRPGSPVRVGAYMYIEYTRYGVDCEGCSGQYTGIGNFGAGIHYDKNYGVRQWDGSYVDGLTYQGYYIIAADKALPYCTVMRIENHHWEGAGIVSGQPFEVIVLDRGGAITGNHIDLFVGLQSNMSITYGKWVTSKDTKATIVKFGKWTKNSLGQYGCAL